MVKLYDSYEDSGVEWIGELPSNWTLIRGKFLFHNKKEINRENQELNLLSLTLNGVLNKDINSNEGLRPTDYSTYQVFEKDDLVFKLIDLENTQTSRVGLVHERGIMSPVYIRLETNIRIDPKYSYYYYYDLYKQHIFNFLGSGVRSSLTPSNLLEIELPVPPLSVQQQIVSFLDTKTSLIDSLIEKTQRKIELLKEKRTSLINEVVTKGLNPNVEMKDSGVEWIGKIPDGWFISKVKFISKVYGRIGFRGYKTTDLVEEGEGVITLSPSNIYEGKLVLNKKTYLSYEKYYESPEIIIKSDDIVYVQRGSTIGKSTIIPKEHPEMTINPQLIIIKDHKSSPRLTYYLMNSKLISIQTQNELNGGSTPMISQNSVENFIIPISKSIDEQQQIVDYLDEQTGLIDKTVSIEEKRIELLKEYRQSLISEVVTGKLKVVE